MKTEFKYEECFGHIMTCEDHFMENFVFLNGFRKEPTQSSMMAYGTVLDYENFNKAWDKIKDHYSVDCWMEMCEYWDYQVYLSSIPRLFVLQILHKVEKTLEDLHAQMNEKGKLVHK